MPESTRMIREATARFAELGTQGAARISYFDATNGWLKFARKVGSLWFLDIIDNTGLPGWYTSLALDSDGNPRISYYEATSVDLKLATRNSSMTSSICIARVRTVIGEKAVKS